MSAQPQMIIAAVVALNAITRISASIRLEISKKASHFPIFFYEPSHLIVSD
jgi:hypothetical protein